MKLAKIYQTKESQQWGDGEPREEYVETTDPDYAAQIVRVENTRPTRCGIGYLLTRNLSNFAYSELLEL